jgi:acyl-CoA thioesterase FadM
MNLWLRLLWLITTASRRSKLRIPEEPSSLLFRVWPHDLDPSLHMNNARYLALMDLGRLDILLRTGLWRVVRRRRWTPVVNAAVIRFRRELRPFESFRLETRVLAWAEATVIMEQTFVFAGGERDGQVAARALFKGALYDRAQRAYVPVARLMEEMGESAVSPPLTAEVEAFLVADLEIKRASASLRESSADS